MDTQDTPLPPENDFRPQDQQDRAASARPNPNDPILNAASPNYGEFGGVTPSGPMSADYGTQVTNSTQPGRDGSNDNPDEFSELDSRESDARRAPRNPADQPGHVEQNQNPGAVRAARGQDDDVQRAAWAKDDPRYAGGGSHNTRDESANTDDGND